MSHTELVTIFSLTNTAFYIEGMKMKLYLTAALALAVSSLALASSAAAYTCDQHYAACLRYNHGPVICGCAKAACKKQVGSGDANDKWDDLPGIKACWRKK